VSEQRTELRAILSVGVTQPSGELRQACYGLVQEQVESRGGWLFRRELEGMWCAFPSLREALRAAYQMFRQDPTGRYGFRFGLHMGDVTITPEGDVLGHVLSVAKRLETATSAGHLLISKESADRLEELPDELQAETLAPLELKGVGRLEARRLSFPAFSLADSLTPAEWERLRRGELLICLVGPLGGPAELRALDWARQGFFYEQAEDREAELGRASLENDMRQWGGQLTPLPTLQSALANPCLPCLSFFPDPRLAGLPCVADQVITEADLDDLWARLPQVLSGWETALSAHTLFWVGAADWVEVFHREVRRRFPAGPEQSQFLIDLGDPPLQGEEEVGRWKKRGFRIYSGLEQLTQVATRLAQPVAQEPSTVVESDRPYRFLDPFGARERALFFGRERESALLRSWILTRRWLVLFGRSGVGKSSLLGAGVLPWLEDNGLRVWTVRCLTDPMAQLEILCAERDLFQGISRVSQSCPRLVIVFDQFEEFFMRLSPGQRRPLAELLKKLCELPRLHLLFSLREDFLAELASLEEWIPTLLDSRFRLTSLTREQARQSILGPAALFELDVEEALLEELLNELESQGVEPPELQIVMDRLWHNREGQSLTLEGYRRLGGVRTILLDYLRESLEGDLSQGPWGRELPRQVMRAMVSERGTKSAQTLACVLRRLTQGNPGAEPEAVCDILDRLVDLRLARKFVGGDDQYYELSHEYLIEEIQSWASEDELALRHAQMVLQSELESWESLGSLISPDRLTMVVRELHHRLAPSQPEAQLLLRASMVHGIPLEWMCPAAGEVLLGMLDEEWSGWVQRRVLAELARLEMDDRAHQRFLQAARKHSNPTLLAEVRQPLIEVHGANFYAALAQATRHRFYGEEAMALVAAGPAWLGSTASNREERKSLLPKYWHARIDSEREKTLVELDRYWIDKTPVSNLQFAEFRPAHIDRYPDEEDEHPVVCVSWHDAQAYAEWLGKQLVCEERWEKAARGCHGNLFPWGDHYDPALLNAQEGGLRSTTRVGAHPAGASPYGCLDMAGNIWEWTASNWSDSGPFKVQKGGSTLNPAPLQQCSTRMEAFPDFVLQWVGFRLMSLEGA
jgi:formylglycine-generating enzyme required for sulfatase activity